MRRTFAAFIFLFVFATLSVCTDAVPGRIDVTVTDAQGGTVPGVLVEIGGPATISQTTDETGEAHFLNLPPGRYSVEASLTGFNTYRNENVDVTRGHERAAQDRACTVSGVTEAVQVRAETPVVDPGRQTITTSVSFDELQRMPSARDPWVMLQTVPGVVVDRVNVGGAESGQQSNVLAKGAGVAENTWNLDGIPVTDLAATGSSPTYYNFDMFQEMSVTTGGASATNPTAGAQLNMQFKTGANTLAGAAHFYGAGESLQSTNLPDELLPLAGPSGKGNRMKELTDFGFDLGGPIVRDRWWAWGSYGRTDGTLYTLNGDPDAHQAREHRVQDVGADRRRAIRPEFLFFRGNKVKNGRGASPLRAPETTWDQTGPTPLYKGQVNIVAGNNVFLTARAGYVGNGFSLTPQGGLDTTGYRDAGRVRHGSYVFYETESSRLQRPRRRQLVPRPARDRVRRQLAQDPGRRAPGISRQRRRQPACRRLRDHAAACRPISIARSSRRARRSTRASTSATRFMPDASPRSCRCASTAPTRRCSRAAQARHPRLPEPAAGDRRAGRRTT